MPRTGVTKEQVFATCDKLFEKGESVTVRSVRKALNTGSYNTITAFVNEWKALDDEKAGGIPEYDIPIPVALHSVLKQVWNLALSSADTTIHDERVKQLEIENESLQVLNAELEKKVMGYEEMKGRVQVLESLASQFNEKMQEVGALKEQVKNLQQQKEIESSKRTKRTSEQAG